MKLQVTGSAKELVVSLPSVSECYALADPWVLLAVHETFDEFFARWVIAKL